LLPILNNGVKQNLGGTWVQTSYNTHGGVNNRVGGEVSLRKNYAGIGYTFDGIGFAMHHSHIHLGQRMQTLIYGKHLLQCLLMARDMLGMKIV
jgi:hypothetical protein